MELDKTYNPKDFEKRIYDDWMKKGYFKASANSKKLPYTIVMPPPNITGQLHIGHALDHTMQDAIIRFKRMQGYEALWLPGTDHASIATEVKIVDKIKKEEGKTKQEIGRDEFMKRAWAWKKQYGDRITEQIKRLGDSCDWSRLAFTMDERCSRAVARVFVNLYDKGLIYRGARIINWCPCCKTALSDAEVEYSDEASFFWHLRYKVKDSDEYVTVATTRPETMLGDTAVAVNPKDKRYASLVGKTLILPLADREIPVVADSYVDMQFGTGAVKITPAHDPNDFEVGLRHNLPVIRVMNDDGTMNELAGKYAGLDRYEARKQIVEALKACGALVKIEPHTHSVGHCYRCHDTIEPIVSKQWFVKMEPLAKPAIAAVKDKSIKFTPKRFTKIYYNWMENVRDWCISRQLWWGHRIPAYYCDECGETVVAETAPTKCPKCGCTHFHQDEDVLDTWFSSALWPFSTLGYPDHTPDLDFFYPTDTLVTAYDIIFFWVARMAFSSLKQMNCRPFKDCIIHGLIRDKQGRKMSKSLGNGIDPMDMIDEYGCDALRFYLTTTSAMGMDIRFDTDKVASTWNFINKLWNASRFVLMKLEGFKKEDYSLKNLNNADKWILTKLNETIKKVTKTMDKYEFNNAGSELYSFIWDDFCDKYIEMSKFSESNETKSTLLYTITAIVKMMHPFMPFVTEEIYSNFEIKDNDILLMTEYPIYDKKLVFKSETKEIDEMLEYVTLFRNKKTESKITSEFEVIDYNNNELLNKMLKLTDKIVSESKYKDKLTIELYNYKFDLFFDNSKNSEEEELKRKEEIEKLEASISRRKKLLSNENYVNKAPEAIVNKEREDLGKEEKRLEILKKN